MTPGAEQAGDGPTQRTQGAHLPFGHVAVSVLPAREREDRHLHLVVMAAHGILRPIRVARLVLGPLLEPKIHGADPCAPLLAPAIADHDGVGRQGQPTPHVGRPLRVVEHHGAAHIVDVVLEAVVAARAEENRLQCGRAVPPCRDHERIDRAPRLSHHADIAVAERQACDLLDHLDAIGQFLLGIFVGDGAFRIAGSLQIDAEAEITVGREPGVHLAVAVHRAVAATVRIELDDGRAFLSFGRGRCAVPVVTVEGYRRAAAEAHGEGDHFRQRHLVECYGKVIDRSAIVRQSGPWDGRKQPCRRRKLENVPPADLHGHGFFPTERPAAPGAARATPAP